jgi:hypothetical protein
VEKGGCVVCANMVWSYMLLCEREGEAPGKEGYDSDRGSMTRHSCVEEMLGCVM